ncbi:MAG: iron ABC transporter permease [Pseudomonadota bacterium]
MNSSSLKRIAPVPTIIGLSILLTLAIIAALVLGAVSISPESLYALVFNQPLSLQDKTIVLNIRLPRVLLAACIGAILAVCGAVMQGLFRNPLADPSLIGVTAGASLGASIVIVLFANQRWLGLPMISLGAFVGGICAVAFVYGLSRRGYGSSVATMLLGGIAITALAGSINSLLEFYASNDMLRRMSLWQMGSLDGANASQVLLALVVVLVLCMVLPPFGQSLNALLLGESEAKSLGIDTERLKKALIVFVAAGVGISVALAGTIAFIGLVVPHILRLLIGPDHRFLMPASALGGALLLVLADTLARTVMAPTELPAGLLTALIGVPFFISLLQRRYVYGLA